MINLEEKGAKRPKDWLVWKTANGTGYHFGIVARGVLYSLGILNSVAEAKNVILRTYGSSVRQIAEIKPKPGVRVLAVNRAIARELGIHRIDPAVVQS